MKSFIVFPILLLLFSSCQKTEESGIDKIIIWGLNDSISIDENLLLSAKAIKGQDTTEISGVQWVTTGDGLYSFSNNILSPIKIGNTKISCQYESFSAEKLFTIAGSGVIKKTDYKIKNLAPPPDVYSISEGSCGEAVLWTICQYFGKNLSQKEINKIGGDPKRGLHGNEVIAVLDSLKIPYKNMKKAETWASTVDTLKNAIIGGNPIILGVKIYPDQYPAWSADHFILLTGMNTKSNLFYFNSFSCEYSIPFIKLSNTNDGYSLVNRYNSLYAIEILL
jgi:hypothetical protein